MDYLTEKYPRRMIQNVLAFMDSGQFIDEVIYEQD